MILNIARREFLGWLAAGNRVYRSDGGKAVAIVGPGNNRPCAGRLREWTEHVPPLAELQDRRWYGLTAEGRKLKEST